MQRITQAQQSKFEYGGISIRRIKIPREEGSSRGANLALVDAISMKQEQTIPATETQNDLVLHYVLQGSVKLSMGDNSFLLNQNSPHIHYSTDRKTLKLTAPFVDSEILRVCFSPQASQPRMETIIKAMPPAQLSDSIYSTRWKLGFSHIEDIINNSTERLSVSLPYSPFEGIYIRVIKGDCIIDNQLLQAGDVILGHQETVETLEFSATARLIVIRYNGASTLTTFGLLASE